VDIRRLVGGGVRRGKRLLTVVAGGGPCRKKRSCSINEAATDGGKLVGGVGGVEGDGLEKRGEGRMTGSRGGVRFRKKDLMKGEVLKKPSLGSSWESRAWGEERSGLRWP